MCIMLFVGQILLTWPHAHTSIGYTKPHPEPGQSNLKSLLTQISLMNETRYSSKRKYFKGSSLAKSGNTVNNNSNCNIKDAVFSTKYWCFFSFYHLICSCNHLNDPRQHSLPLYLRRFLASLLSYTAIPTIPIRDPYRLCQCPIGKYKLFLFFITQVDL